MNSHETHISAQQTPPQENPRFPCSHENSRRPQGDQPPPPPRPQEIGRLARGQEGPFRPDMRLKSRREFQRVAREGKRLVGRFLCIDYRRASKSKLGISASARYGSAPERSRFKRLVREAFRKNYMNLPRYELNVVPRQLAKNARFADISEELLQLLK